jgi:serine/threonine-protein kinase
MAEYASIPPDAPELVGKIIGGKYRVHSLVGTGGMGTVWEGVHTKLGTRVAIKFIKPAYANHDEARARFEIEARAAARLQSKNAVQVYDYGVSDDGLPYIVMEYLEGHSLSDAIIERGPLQPQEVATIIGQAARALAKAHASGIVHRDLKPDNIFLAKSDDASDEPYIVKLVDFGIAKIFDEPSASSAAQGGKPSMGGPTKEGTVIGTPNFMSPEQLTVGGAPGPLTDLWSLGACTFAAMTGRIPFEGDVLGDIVLKVCAAPMPAPSRLNPNLPQGFDAWFARACSRDPTKRFQTAQELADSLASVCGMARVRTATLDEDQIQYVLRRAAPDAVPAEDIPMPSSMSPKTALLMGLVLGVAMMVGLLGFLAWRQNQNADASPPPPATQIAPPPSTIALPTNAPPASVSGATVDAGKPRHP